MNLMQHEFHDLQHEFKNMLLNIQSLCIMHSIRNFFFYWGKPLEEGYDEGTE